MLSLVLLLWQSNVLGQGQPAQGPSLQIDLTAGQQVKLSWPDNAAGYVLERAAILPAGATWTGVNVTPVIQNGRSTVSVAVTASQQYFRLRGSTVIALTTIARTSPANGEAGVSVNRETIVEFSEPLGSGALIDTEMFHANFGSRRLLSRVEISSDRRKATLFYLEPVPAGARISVSLVGDSLLDALGQAVDADGDGTPGGTMLLQFDTMSTAAIPATAVIGHVFASDPVSTGTGFTNRPLQNVIVTVDGAEEKLRAFTDAAGFFRLSCPAGRFFVHIDGRTAEGSDWPNEAYYPFVGKTFEAVPGNTNNLAGGSGEVFLPLIEAGTLQSVSATQPTTVTFPAQVLAQNPALQGVTVTVPPNDLFADNGTRGGRVGIAPVPADRLPAPLPQGLAFPLVITIQTDGPSNFDQPVPVRFPNLPDPVTGEKLPPGAKSALWSYDHDTGRWEIQGSMTVTADGNFVETDPGVGVRQPGWHGVNPGNSGDGGGGDDNPNDPCAAEQQGIEDAVFGCVVGVAISFWGFVPEVGCMLNLGSAAVSIIHDCSNPGNNCIASTLYNGIFGGLGCIPGVGTAMGFAQCGANLGGAVADLAICQMETQPPPGSAPQFVSLGQDRITPANAAAFPEDPLDQQQKLIGDYRNLVISILGDEQWLQAAYLDDVNARTFFTNLVVALGEASEAGVELSQGERTSLLNLPSPGGLSVNVRTALLDRFNRFSAQGMTAAEIAAVETAGATLSATATELQKRGWKTMFDGLLTAWRQLNLDFDQARKNRPLRQRPLFYRLVDQETGFVRQGRLNNLGRLDPLPLAANRDYMMSYLDPETLEIGTVLFRAGPPGGNTSVPRARMTQLHGDDSDNDGLFDVAEAIVGTDPTKPDTDGDGVSDFDEVRQGLDPLSGLNLPVGVIANVPLPGDAYGVRHFAGHAYVATALHGLAVVDIQRIDAPVLVGQLDLPGLNFTLAISPTRQTAAVAATAESGIGLGYAMHIVDVSDPTAPRLLQSLSIPVRDVAEYRGLFLAGLEKEVRIYDATSGLELGWMATTHEIFGLTAAEGRLYVATDTGLEIYQIELPTPGLLSHLDLNVALVGRFNADGDMVLQGNVLHAGSGNGYLTIDVSDPTKPVLIAKSSMQFPPILHALDLNGSGLMMGLISFSANNRDLAVYDASDPTKVETFLFSVDTLNVSRGLDLVSGVALVADFRSGLTIINPLRVDGKRQPPTVTADLGYLDNDPARAGIQVTAGTTLSARTSVADDVQMRETHLLVDGRTVSSVDAGPTVFDFTAPSVPSAGGTINVQFQAVDTGGNVGSSAAIPLEVTTNSTPPSLEGSFPGDASGAFSKGALVFRFDRSLDASPRDASRVALIYLGADGQVGGGDDVAVPVASVRAVGETLLVTPGAPLKPGPHQLTIPSALLSDSLGNKPSADLVTRFTAFDAALGTAIWISTQDGRFDDSANWLQKRVPGEEDVLLPEGLGQPVVSLKSSALLTSLESHLPMRLEPSGSLSVEKIWTATSPVVISNGAAFVTVSGTFSAPVQINGGRLQTSGPLTFADQLTVNRGGTLTLDGTNAQFVLTGGFTAQNFKIVTQNRAGATFPQFTNYRDPGDFSGFLPVGSLFQANGQDSVMVLPELVSAEGPVDWKVFGVPAVQFQAIGGGAVQLPKLTTLTNRTVLTATDSGSLVNATNLTAITGPVSDFISSINASGGGRVVLGANTLLTRCNVSLQTFQTPSALQGGTIELAENSSLEGVGTVTANVVNRGIIQLDSAPGKLVIDGNLALTSTSIVNVSIGLGATGTDAGQIETHGDVSLGGVFRITPVRGFTPTAGQQFDAGVFSKPPTGAFSQVDDAPLGPALKAELVQSNSGLQIKILAR